MSIGGGECLRESEDIVLFLLVYFLFFLDIDRLWFGVYFARKGFDLGHMIS